ncbi:Neopullulanase [hydrothermal vent metagenome]|uniref:Neopullulanase n=1 Tax=hydrothermal vent metagenome TaxID=652676 RepID=A0A3B1CBV3_9ZZZZ
MRKIRSFLFIAIAAIVSLLVNSCGEEQNTRVKDIIPNINLSAGKETSVVFSDLFYAPTYNPLFTPNENIKIKYDSDANALKLKPNENFEGMTLVEFKVGNEFRYFPVSVIKDTYYKFHYKPDKEYKKLTLFGSFNGWNRTEIPLTDENHDGIFETEVALVPGTYQYKFYGDGIEIVDPENPNKVPNGFGDFNSVITIEEDTTNKVFLHQLSYEMTSAEAVYSFYYQTNRRDVSITNEDLIALLDNQKIDLGMISAAENIIKIILPLSDLENKRTLRVAVTKNGKNSNMQHLILYDGIPANNRSGFDWHDGIIYSLMIDRFYDGDSSLNKKIIHDSLSDKANYMGGDLQGIISKLNEGYFDSLGVNTIWISPVYDNPNIAFREYPKPHRWFSGYHGYWPISSTRVEEKFGTLDDVKQIVKIAHEHNIKILLDFVSNHVHIDHPYYKEHRDWFGSLYLPDGRKNIRFYDEFRLTTWFEPYLPSFDYLGSKEALDTMISNAVWWLNITNADGFRHDAVKHVPNKFWRGLTRKLKREIEIPQNKPIYQVGETFGSYSLISSYVNNGQLSGQFNFNLYDTALPTFIKSDASFSSLDKEMHKTFSVYGELHLMSNIMDSHDKNRFMAYADGDLDVSEWSAIEKGWNDPPQVDDPKNYKKLILYMAYMNSIPGIPVIYYGSEFGMTGASDPDNRRMMRFNNQLSKYEKETKQEVSRIINLRKENTALRYGDFYTITADKDIYAYIRSDMNERVLVILNKNNEERSYKITLPEFYGAKTLTDLKTGEQLSYPNAQNLIIPSWDWKMFVIE